MIILLTSVAVIARVYYVSNVMSEVKISEDIYNAAKVTVGTTNFSSFFSDGINLKSVYICSLYLIFLIFGNFTVAGVYLNLLYQVLTVLLLFIAIRNVSNRYVGFVAGMVAALVPVYMETLSEVTVFNMHVFLAAIGCSLLTLIVSIFYNRYRGKKNVSNDHEVAELTGTVSVDETEQKNAIQSVQDHSMKEIKLDDLEEKKVKFIANPLPVPKRREHKEMDFVVELTEENDDYDLKDLSGKDFFDIE